MISPEQYRVKIGLFSHTKICIGSTSQRKMSRRIFLMCVLLSLLLLSGDVESNPGPKINNDEKKLLIKKFQSLKSELKAGSSKQPLSPAVKTALLKNLQASLRLLKQDKSVQKKKMDYRLLADFRAKRLEKIRQERKKFDVDLRKLDLTRSEDDSGDILYEDANLKFFVKRTAFKKQKNFKLQDYKYEMKVEEKQNDFRDNTPPTLISIIEHLHQVLFDIVDELRTQLNAEEHSQIYFCFTDDGFDGNINTGNYSLHAGNSANIVNEVISILESTLRSKDYLKLNSSFTMLLTVVSVEHVKHKMAQGYLVTDNKSGAPLKNGIINILSNETIKNFISIPQNDERFQNKCLPASVILGYYHKKHLQHLRDKSCKVEDKIYKSIQRINQKEAKLRKNSHCIRAKLRLLDLIDELLDELGFPEDGPYDLKEFLIKASTYLNFRFHVYSNQGNKRCFVYPNKFDFTQPQIFLYEEVYEDSEISHTSLILKPSTFFVNTGYLCQYCDKLRFRHHVCQKKKMSCFGCHRINAWEQQDVHIDSLTKNHFCMKGPNVQKVVHVCKNCNVTTFTDDCWKVHLGKKRVCQRGYYCPTCKTYTVRNSKFSTWVQMKESHKCFYIRCRLCNMEYQSFEDHCCLITPQSQQVYMKSLAFFDLECTTGAASKACTDCFDIEHGFITDHMEKIKVLLELQTLLQTDYGLSEENQLSVKEIYAFAMHVYNHPSTALDSDYMVTKIKNIPENWLQKLFLSREYTSEAIKRKNIEKLLQNELLDSEWVKCEKHSKSLLNKDFHVPNYCVLYNEVVQHGTFERIDFAAPEMCHPNDLVLTENAFLTNYLPEEASDAVLELTTKKTGNFCSNLIRGSKTSFPISFKADQVYAVGDESFEECLNSYVNDECIEEENLETETYEDEDLIEGEDLENDSPASLPKSTTICSLQIGGKSVEITQLHELQVIDKFLLYICNERFRNFTFLSHNGSGYDMSFICKALYKHGITPSIISRNMKILQITIRHFNISFIDSMLYISGSLDQLSKTFKLESQKGFFPHGFNDVMNYDYTGECPPLETFQSFNDCTAMKLKKKLFHEETRQKNYIWNFQHEIAAYCNLDVRILTEAMCLFLKQALQFQVNLQKKLCPGRPPDLLNPFTPPFLTISGFVFGVWRRLYLPKFPIYSLKDEKGLTSIPVSNVEQQVVLYYAWKHNDYEMLSSFTSP